MSTLRQFFVLCDGCRNYTAGPYTSPENGSKSVRKDLDKSGWMTRIKKHRKTGELLKNMIDLCPECARTCHIGNPS